MAQNNSDEIDLGIVFDKIKKVTNNFLISIYNGIQFLFKHWWKLLLLAIIGGVVGYFLEQKNEPNKLTTMIVQNNFNSSNYVSCISRYFSSQPLKVELDVYENSRFC